MEGDFERIVWQGVQLTEIKRYFPWNNFVAGCTLIYRCHRCSGGTQIKQQTIGKKNFMDFIKGKIYHIYNRGNNKNQIFYTRKNYEFFLRKIKTYILPNCDILSYILMPNHFHILIHANKITQRSLKKGIIITNPLSEGLRLMLSSYAQAINKQEGKTGNLFQQNTTLKCVSLKHTDYSYVCFKYIHQNPLKAGLVEKLENWHYSSFNEYLPSAKPQYCNKKLATRLLDLNMKNFYYDSYEAIEEDVSKIIF